MKRLHLALLATALLSGLATAQYTGPTWQTATTISPPLRRWNPGTADLAHMYVFGGFDGASSMTPLNDLWRFDGTAWAQMTADGAPGSPPARAQAGVSWNFTRNRLMVFGGSDGAGGIFGDTWEWDPTTNTWTDVTPVGVSPSPRRLTALTQAPSGDMILFGGEDASGDTDDTWLFDGTTWTQVNLGPGSVVPNARQDHSLEYRSDLSDVVLSQGYSLLKGYQKDTFIWDGQTWNQVSTGFVPTGAVELDSAYDSLRGRTLLIGGGPGLQGDVAELRSFDNTFDMHFPDPGIGKIKQYFIAYVPALNKTYKYGGIAEDPTKPPHWTYECQTDAPASVTVSGVGCPGVAGVPTISGKLPWLNEALYVELGNLAPSELGLLLFGLDNSSWLTIPLPLDLGPILGTVGCNLYLAPIFEYTQVLGAGPAPPPLNASLPNNTSFAGLELYLQGLVADTVGGGFSTSALLTATLGWN